MLAGPRVGNLLLVLLERVSSFDLCQLDSCVLIKELINAHIATANSYSQLALCKAHFHALGSELVLAG